MSKLAESHVEQIKAMRTEGKTYADIIAFFQTTYGIKIYAAQILKAAGATRPAEQEAVKDAPVIRAKHYRKRKKRLEKSLVVAEPENDVKAIVILVNAIKAKYNSVFKYLRAELMRSRAEVCEMLAGAGIKDEEDA